ncbi:hypothetical protein ACN9JG_21355 (plasmid) [Cereibacter azotoformans]|uniref:Uncharacterized protein n=1 Tax=Cereibacter azotoformans TaxID=43057 RepID=A0A2T5JSU6_9RHOB|nr:hypothetical protein [Cereibacter azotoformans]PTR12062.1 hypothetical protein C8J28_12521 [Cereibacter azotoformans]
MTTRFERKLDTSLLDLPLAADFLPFNDLLRAWVPAGDGTAGGANMRDGLRLAIRRNYVNFYLAGQSVARVDFGQRPKCLKLTVHDKYVRGEQEQGQKTMRFVSGKPSDTPAIVADWISNARANAEGKAKRDGDREKTFVDEVISHNPNVIDVEMAMPGVLNDNGNPTAPRMDIVALEPHGDGWQLVFWEAKLSRNDEAKSLTEPQVFRQLEKYRTWLRDHEADVIAAYQQTCRILVDFRERTMKSNPDIGELGSGIRAVADGAVLALDPTIRLLIDGRKDTGRFADRHLAPLKEETTAHLVQKDADLILPVGTTAAAAPVTD